MNCLCYKIFVIKPCELDYYKNCSDYKFSKGFKVVDFATWGIVMIGAG